MNLIAQLERERRKKRTPSQRSTFIYSMIIVSVSVCCVALSNNNNYFIPKSPNKKEERNLCVTNVKTKALWITCDAGCFGYLTGDDAIDNF